MIRNDFVSNSSSSSFIIDKETWDKHSPDIGSLGYSTFNLYEKLDNNPHIFEIEIGPDPCCNIENIRDFLIEPDKDWIKSFMDGGAYPYSIPKTLKKYATKYMELVDKYKNLWDVHHEIRDIYVKDLVKKVIKPNVENMELIEIYGADDECTDDDYDNDEDKCREICWDVINKGAKLWHANTHH